MLPLEMDCGSGVTWWRRLSDWQAVGIWERLHHELLCHLQDANVIDWNRAALDSSSLAAKEGGGPRPGRTRPIMAVPAQGATSSQTVKVSRSRVPFPGPTCMTACPSSRCSMEFRRSAVSVVALGAGRECCVRTRSMITVAAAAPAGGEALRRASLGVASRPVNVSTAIAGSSNAHSLGLIAFGASPFATSDASTSIARSLASPALSLSAGPWRGDFERGS